MVRFEKKIEKKEGFRTEALFGYHIRAAGSDDGD